MNPSTSNPNPFESDDEWLAGYVLGNLTPDEQARVEHHLAQHPHRIAEVEHLRSTLALLALAAPQTEPPDSLRDRLLQAAHRVPARRFRKGWTHSRQWGWGVGTGIAAMILVGLGLDNHRLSQELTTAQETLQVYEGAIALLQQPENRLLNLQPVSTTQSPTGSLVLSPRGDTAMLTLQNLAPLPKGHVYRMWALTNGEKFDCATFTPDASGQVFIKLPMEEFWNEATTVVVNIEPAQPTPTANAEMVLWSGTP